MGKYQTNLHSSKLVKTQQIWTQKMSPAIMNLFWSINAEKYGHVHKSSPAITDKTDDAQKGTGGDQSILASPDISAPDIL